MKSKEKSDKKQHRINKQKKGRPASNADQNKQFRQALTSAGLDKNDRVLCERIKRCIEHCSRELGLNLGFNDIKRIAKFMISSPVKECKCDA
ncbi:MAG: hypothetical protein V2I97_01660 [Desulfococcaceae bacterium]|jgi:hypothetical protein|nr:hypothetical protein [Desulfococcaceae bacterium]